MFPVLRAVCNQQCSLPQRESPWPPKPTSLPATRQQSCYQQVFQKLPTEGTDIPFNKMCEAFPERLLILQPLHLSPVNAVSRKAVLSSNARYNDSFGRPRKLRRTRSKSLSVAFALLSRIQAVMRAQEPLQIPIISRARVSLL